MKKINFLLVLLIFVSNLSLMAQDFEISKGNAVKISSKRLILDFVKESEEGHVIKIYSY